MLLQNNIDFYKSYWGEIILILPIYDVISS